MDTTIAYEASKELSTLLDRVSKGERITITRDGVPVAVIQPPDGERKRTSREAVEELKRFRKGKTLGNLTIRQMIEEGRD